MVRPAITVLGAMTLIVAILPLRSAASAASEAPRPAPAAVDPVAGLADTFAPVDGRAYTVRIAAFVDPDGSAGERMALELQAAGLEVGLERERRGEMVSRLRVGTIAAADAERLASALKDRYAWPVYVTRAP